MTDDALVPDLPEDPEDDSSEPAFDIGALLGAAQSMQAQLLEGQQRIMTTIIEGTAGSGAVAIAVTGGFDFQRVTISPSAVDPDDHSLLEDLVLAALRDAATQIMALQNAANPLAGLDGGLDGLGGLLGGA